MSKRLSLSVKIYGVVALALGGMVLLCVLGVIQHRIVDRTARQVHSRELGLVQEADLSIGNAIILLSLTLAENDIGKLAREEGQFLESLDTASKALDSLAERYHVTEDRKNRDSLAEIRATLPELRERGKKLYYYAKNFFQVELIEAYRSSVAPLIEKVRAKMATISQRELVEIDESAARIAAVTDNFYTLEILASLSIMSLVAGTSLYLVRQRIVAPLREVVRKTAEVLAHAATNDAGSDSTFSWQRLQHEEVHDEIGEVLASFDKLVETLLDDLRATRSANQAALEAVEAAEQANRAKSTFVATMSHEIRTPLSGVVGIASLLDETDLSPKQKRYVALLRKSAVALSSLLNDILDFSKIEAGKLELEVIAFHLPYLLRDTVDVMAGGIQGKDLHMTCEIDPSVPALVRGDPDRLRQVIVNLLGNALKFTDRGAIRLAAKLLSHTEETVEVHFEVQDTGVGFPPDVADSLFDSFSQADSSTTRQHGGTGLGLTICKNLLRLMSGDISAQSEPGYGSVFSFTARFGQVKPGDIDHVSLPEDHNYSRSLQPAAEGRPLRILVAEDNEVNQIVAISVLATMGHSCHVVSDGRQAVQEALTGNYDLVLMDCRMPLLDGFDAARSIRDAEARQHIPRIPIIALTANAVAQDSERCLAAGMDDYLAKPLQSERLLESISRLVPASRRPL